MAKRLEIKPDWLHRLLLAWAKRAIKQGSGPLGYPSVCPMFSERVQAPQGSREPWDLTGDDLNEVALAIAELESKHRLAITRAYKPWTIPAISNEVAAYGVTDRTWTRWCHEAALQLGRKLERKTEAWMTVAA